MNTESFGSKAYATIQGTYRIPSRPVSDARKRCPWNKSYRLSDTFSPTEGPRATINSNKNTKY